LTFPLYLNVEDGRMPWVIEREYINTHGHGFVLAPNPNCAACRKENMADKHKDHFIAVLTAAETKGLLPKGKTADILENYDFLVDEIDAATKLLADEPVPFTPESNDRKTQPNDPLTFDPNAPVAKDFEKPAIPEGDSSEGQTFVKGKGKKAPPPDAA